MKEKNSDTMKLPLSGTPEVNLNSGIGTPDKQTIRSNKKEQKQVIVVELVKGIEGTSISLEPMEGEDVLQLFNDIKAQLSNRGNEFIIISTKNHSLRIDVKEYDAIHVTIVEKFKLAF